MERREWRAVTEVVIEEEKKGRKKERRKVLNPPIFVIMSITS